VENLFRKLNSPQYYSIYPPVNQLVFWLSTGFSVENLWINVLLLRIIILGLELMGFLFFIKLLKSTGSNIGSSYWYWANPLVIMEGIGNLHFEVIMVAFIAAALFNLNKGRTVLSGIFLTLSIGVKLIPLMWLPFLKSIGTSKKTILLILMTLILSCILFLPVLGPGYQQNFVSSLDLYFHSFEFNASIYFLERAIGWWVLGYNAISFIGSLNFILILIAFGLLFIRSRKEGAVSFIHLMLISYSIYLAFATTVHPWYIIPLVFFGACSGYRYPILFSFLAIFSYEAYAHDPLVENPWLLILEYLPVYIYAIFEFRQRKNLDVSGALQNQ